MSVSAIKAYLNDLSDTLGLSFKKGTATRLYESIISNSDKDLMREIRNSLDTSSAYVPLDTDTIRAEWQSVLDEVIPENTLNREEIINRAINAYKESVQNYVKTRSSRAVVATVDTFNNLVENNLLQVAQDKLDEYNKTNRLSRPRKLLEFHIYERQELIGVAFLSSNKNPGNAFRAVSSLLSSGPAAMKASIAQSIKIKEDKSKLFKGETGHTFFDRTSTDLPLRDLSAFIGETPGSIKQVASTQIQTKTPVFRPNFDPTLVLDNIHKLRGNSTLVLQKTAKVEKGINMVFEETTKYKRVLIYTGSSQKLNQLLAKGGEGIVGEITLGDLIAKKIRNDAKNLKNRRGSPSPREVLKEAMVTALATGKQYSHSSSKTVSDKSSVNKTIKNKVKVSPKVTTKVIKPKAKNLNLGPIRNVTTGQFTSLAKILEMLQGSINEKVRDNMSTPRLKYRTGRFANSVRINNVTRSENGLYTVSYGYQTYPYQTFEPGYAQGSRDRDPRALIGTSIRQIVAPIIGNNFRAVRLGGTGSRGSIE